MGPRLWSGGDLDLPGLCLSWAGPGPPGRAPQPSSLARPHLRNPSAAQFPPLPVRPQPWRAVAGPSRPRYVGHGGWDRVPNELPRLEMARGQGESPRKLWATASSLGCRNLGPCGVSTKTSCHPFSEAGEISAARPYDLRMVGSWEHRFLLQYSGVSPPGPRTPEILTRGLPLYLGLREVEGAVQGGVRPQHVRRSHSGAPEGASPRKGLGAVR